MTHFKNAILFLFLFIPVISFSQRSLKYENIVKKSSEVSNKEAFGLYSDFLSLNLFIERSNLYFQLGELSANMIKDLNPLTDYLQIKKLHHKSQEYYLLCEQYVNDNDARKDQSFFVPPVEPAQKRLTAQDVITYTKGKQEKDQAFFEKITSTYNSYTYMINSYFRCMDIYTAICHNNRNINDVYINWSSNINLLNSLKSTFDSVVYFRNELNDNVPNFGFKEIKDFKIDGLTPDNFGAVSEIWDYKNWAIKQEDYYDKTISHVLEKSLELSQALNTRIDNINRSKKPDFKEIETDNSLMEQLRNIQDITSLYTEIEQKNNIINFLNLAYNETNSATSGNYAPSKQSLYICSLVEAYNRVIKANKQMEINYPSIKKNTTELDLVNVLYNKSIDKFKGYIINTENLYRKTAHINHNKTQIPLYPSFGFYRPSGSGYITKNILNNADGSIFLGGSSVNAQGFSVAYTAYSYDAHNTNWLKTVDVAKVMYDDCSMAICKHPGGVLSLISSKNVSDPLLTTQTIVQYDMKGAEKQKITLADKNLPLGRYISYDPITETTLLAFYGDMEDCFQNTSMLIIQKNKGEKQIFRSEIQLNGHLINIFPASNGGYIVFGNYIELVSPTGKVNTDLGVFSLLINNEGKITKTTTYLAEKMRYGIAINRVGTDKFVISGINGDIRRNDSSPYTTEGDPVFILTDSNGGLIYDYKKAK